MLRELWEAWRGHDALTRMFDEFDRMLYETHWMFQQAVEVFFSRVDWQAVQDPLYQRDKTVNKLERSIRSEIVKHLTVRQDANVAACLVLMSVVKDAERIGDYCKNIFEVGKFYTREFTGRKYFDPLERIRMKVEAIFNLTKDAFSRSDVDLARQVQKEFGECSKRCDDLIRLLLQERDNLPTDEAVAYSLLARHMKRIGAHLSNISSAVIAPVHKLDYMDEAAPGEMS
jgi:phosphate transport system protein